MVILQVDLSQLATLKRQLEVEIEEMRSGRQLTDEFVRKVELLSSTNDRLNYELFRKNELKEAIRETANSIKTVRLH